ncbi:hypothetical protein H5410_022274 [Solanum commersonii]|uniref:Uncharacterized protein n=1 Tax=Solanum commersonii TaxID=4109 RepID=A0A9J5ZDR6_SOLCO|nr:hypothetical protein H5410_022274 [Solanum commersonii]
MTNPTAFDSIGPGHIMISNDSPETFEDKTTIQHIPPPTNNNLPPMTYPNPTNLPSTYTSPQSQPPTYTTYATPPNPPHVNLQNQPPTHTPYVSFHTNTYPLPTTTLVNTSNSPPPIQNSPTIQTYPIQHIQGAHIATPYAQHNPPVYVVEIQAFTNPISKSLEWEKSWKKESNQEESKTLQPCKLQVKQLDMASTFQNRSYSVPRARPNYEIKTTRNYTKIAEPLAQLLERLKVAGRIQPIEGKIPDSIPKWSNGSKRCAYHSGGVGHDNEDCYGLKTKI